MSTIPNEAFTITGGCSCKAVRYTVHVPPFDERGVVLPAADSNGQGDIRMPQTAVCYCNDCRHSSGSLMLFALMVPFSWSHFSALPRGADSTAARVEFEGKEHLPPKEEMSLGESKAFEGTCLQMYRSSNKAMRCFCSTCGTAMLYVYTGYIPPGGTSGGLDFYLGTVDKECLEALGGIQRTVNGDLAIPWVKDVIGKTDAIRRHPGTKMGVLE